MASVAIAYNTGGFSFGDGTSKLNGWNDDRFAESTF
jgi:hypothetical protein